MAEADFIMAEVASIMVAAFSGRACRSHVRLCEIKDELFHAPLSFDSGVFLLLFTYIVGPFSSIWIVGTSNGAVRPAFVRISA